MCGRYEKFVANSHRNFLTPHRRSQGRDAPRFLLYDNVFDIRLLGLPTGISPN